MPTQELVFGQFLQNRRKTLKLTHKVLATKLGYSNISKGIRRIVDIENGKIHQSLISSLMITLGVTEENRALCNAREQIYIQDYVKILPKFKAVILYRAMACIYVPIEIPTNLRSAQAKLIYAIDFAKEKHAHCCLKLDYNLRYYINKEGGVSKADRRLYEVSWSKPNLGKLL